MKSSLAAALARGQSRARWAKANGVTARTAQRWASEPAVQAEVDAYRRNALDRAVGRMARRFTWATGQIAVLAKTAKSESVRLAALRSILTDFMAISDFSGLEERIAKLEEQDRVCHEESPGFAS
jgi:hypothetical protein